MNTKALRQKILDLAIHGKLVPQDPNEEPASVLLERIRAEKERLVKEGKIKRPKKTKATSDKPHYPYELPKGWAWCKLEDFINDATDFVASGSFASLRENVKYYDEAGYAILVRTKDFQNGFTKGLVYTDRHGYEFLANSNLFGGELILPNIGASIGKVFIVPHLDIRMTLAPNSIMIKCFKDIHKKWLQYLFLSPFGQEQLRIISSSTAQGKFNKTDLRALQIPIPPFDEQERIISEIEFLSHFIEMIEYGQDKLQETIKQAKSKILDLAIHGKLVPQDPTDEPASELLKRINPKAEITCDNWHYQKLPEGWTVCCLENVAKVLDNLRKPINSNERNSRIANKHENELFPYYGATGQVGFIDYYLVDGTFLLLGEDGAPFLDKYAIKSYPIKGKCWVNNHAHILEPLCDFDYLMYYLNHVDYKDYVNGSTRLKLTQSDMRSIIILLPPLTEQKRISVKVKYLFRLLDSIACYL